MPRPKGAGRACDERFRALRDKLIDDMLDDADDREIDAFSRKLQRMADRAFVKSMRKGGCLGLGELSPPESAVMASNVLTLGRAMETREAIKERRAKRKATMMTLIAAVDVLTSGEEEVQAPEIVIVYADGVTQDEDSTQQATESSPQTSNTRE